MNKDTVSKALKQLKETSKKRKFNQRYELIINLKEMNLKKPEEQVDLFVLLHNSSGKKGKICALVGPELKDDAMNVCDTTITVNDFDKYAKNKKLVKKIASEHKFFIAQANMMPKVAQAFGKVLGPRGKMPNPKSGCVVPPKTNLKALYDNLQKTIRAQAKTQLSIKCPVGSEDMKDEEVIDNILTLYNAVIHRLPKEELNIRSALLKLTMSKPVKVN